MKNLRDLFLNQLADLYDAERRILKALPKLAKAATNANLRKALLSHLKESKFHAKTLARVFDLFGAKARGRKCQATAGLLEEATEILITFQGSPAINAALISAAQKIEHYEIASYGCLHAWAGLLGNKEAAGLIQEILDEERGANDALTKLARSICNPEAMGQPGKNGKSGNGVVPAKPILNLRPSARRLATFNRTPSLLAL